MEQNLATILILCRRDRASNLSRTCSDRPRREPRAREVRAQIIHQRVVVELNQHCRR